MDDVRKPLGEYWHTKQWQLPKRQYRPGEPIVRKKSKPARRRRNNEKNQLNDEATSREIVQGLRRSIYVVNTVIFGQPLLSGHKNLL